SGWPTLRCPIRRDSQIARTPTRDVISKEGFSNQPVFLSRHGCDLAVTRRSGPVAWFQRLGRGGGRRMRKLRKCREDERRCLPDVLERGFCPARVVYEFWATISGGTLV